MRASLARRALTARRCFHTPSKQLGSPCRAQHASQRCVLLLPPRGVRCERKVCQQWRAARSTSVREGSTAHNRSLQLAYAAHVDIALTPSPEQKAESRSLDVHIVRAAPGLRAAPAPPSESGAAWLASGQQPRTQLLRHACIMLPAGTGRLAAADGRAAADCGRLSQTYQRPWASPVIRCTSAA